MKTRSLKHTIITTIIHTVVRVVGISLPAQTSPERQAKFRELSLDIVKHLNTYCASHPKTFNSTIIKYELNILTKPTLEIVGNEKQWTINLFSHRVSYCGKSSKRDASPNSSQLANKRHCVHIR
jgi:hypothetical protein